MIFASNESLHYEIRSHLCRRRVHRNICHSPDFRIIKQRETHMIKHLDTPTQDLRKLVESAATMAGTKAAKDIAAELGITYSTLKGIAQAHGISLKYQPVDSHDQWLMRQLRAIYGMTLQEIADKFEVSTGFCSRVCAGIKKPSKAQQALA